MNSEEESWLWWWWYHPTPVDTAPSQLDQRQYTRCFSSAIKGGFFGLVPWNAFVALVLRTCISLTSGLLSTCNYFPLVVSLDETPQNKCFRRSIQYQQWPWCKPIYKKPKKLKCIMEGKQETKEIPKHLNCRDPRKETKKMYKLRAPPRHNNMCAKPSYWTTYLIPLKATEIVLHE